MQVCVWGEGEGEVGGGGAVACLSVYKRQLQITFRLLFSLHVFCHAKPITQDNAQHLEKILQM